VSGLRPVTTDGVVDWKPGKPAQISDTHVTTHLETRSAAATFGKPSEQLRPTSPTTVMNNCLLIIIVVVVVVVVVVTRQLQVKRRTGKFVSGFKSSHCIRTFSLKIKTVANSTRCSAIAERPRCRVHYSFRQK